MDTIQNIGRNSIAVILGCVAGAVIDSFIVIILARYFGHYGFGEICFLGIFFYFFRHIDNFFIRPILVREMSRNVVNADAIIGSGFIIRIIFALIAIILMWTILLFGNHSIDILQLAIFTSISLVISSMGASYDIVFQINLKQVYSKFINFLSKIVTLALLCFVVFLKKDLLFFYVFSTIIGIISFFYIRRYAEKFIKLKFNISFKLWQDIFCKSLPLFISGIFIFVYHRTDQIMLLQMKGVEAVGSYSAAVKFAEVFNIIPIALVASLLPLMSKCFYSKNEYFEKIYQLSFKYLLLFIIPVAFGVAIFSDSITVIIYGDNFLSSGLALRFLIWAEVFVFLGIMNNTILVAANKQIIDPFLTGISAIANILLNFIFIPRYGFVGAAATTLVAYAVGPVIGYFLKTTKKYSLSMLKNFLKPFFASLIMAGFICYFRFFSWWLIIIAPLIYLFIMYFIRGVDYNDLRRIKEVIRAKNAAS